MVVSFTVEGNLSVSSVKQISGVTANNFKNGELDYIVTTQGGASVTYEVTLKMPETPIDKQVATIFITVEGNQEITDKENYLNARFVINYPLNPERNIEKLTQIRGRGNSTWDNPKKPYRLKFNEKTSLFGLGAEKSWVLLANYNDPTLLMNSVAFELGQRMKIPFTNHGHYVDLYINGDYRGNYLLTEQIQVAENRVNIDKKNGFLVEVDAYYDDEPKFKTTYLRLPVMIKSPDVLTVEEAEFVRQDMQAMVSSMFTSIAVPLNNSYRELIDVPSVIDYMLLNEFVCNVDVTAPASVYMHKVNSSSKIRLVPIWDFDWGWGISWGMEYFSEQYMLMYPQYRSDEIGERFFCRFFTVPQFIAEYNSRWNELKNSGVFNLDEYIVSTSEKIKASRIKNFEKWPAQDDYDEELEKMRTWVKERLDYMDKEINKF